MKIFEVLPHARNLFVEATDGTGFEDLVVTDKVSCTWNCEVCGNKFSKSPRDAISKKKDSDEYTISTCSRSCGAKRRVAANVNAATEQTAAAVEQSIMTGDADPRILLKSLYNKPTGYIRALSISLEGPNAIEVGKILQEELSPEAAAKLSMNAHGTVTVDEIPDLLNRRPDLMEYVLLSPDSTYNPNYTARYLLAYTARGLGKPSTEEQAKIDEYLHSIKVKAVQNLLAKHPSLRSALRRIKPDDLVAGINPQLHGALLALQKGDVYTAEFIEWKFGINAKSLLGQLNTRYKARGYR
ncbi:hypothetical protein D3C78_17750 [compost metagenome]